jgi:DNA (cytosine-5)-methyltransferase 1
MRKPRLLDLFCCAGGAGKGYRDAGFEVVGIDVTPQPNYPYEFHQADAMEILRDSAFLDTFNVIHASPPCQMYSAALKHLSAPQPMLIDPVRDALQGRTYVIENVIGSPLPHQTDLFGHHGVMICGTGFGMRIYRHRLFEASISLSAPACNHARPAMNPHNSAAREAMWEEFGRDNPIELHWRREMGVDWMNRQEAREAIPPVYTRHIGQQLIAHLAAKVAA